MLTLRLWMSNMHAGTIIGKGGASVKSIRESSGCKVSIAEMGPGMQERMVSVAGSLAGISRAAEMMLDCLDESNRGGDGVTPDPTASDATQHTLKLSLSNNQVGGLIGKGGASIKQMREDSTANIKVETSPTNQTERLVTVSGHRLAVLTALRLICAKLSSMPDDGPTAPLAPSAKYQRTSVPPGVQRTPYGAVQPPPPWQAATPNGQPGAFAPYGGIPNFSGYPQPGGPQQGYPGQPQQQQQQPGYPPAQQQPPVYPQPGGYPQGYAGYNLDGGAGGFAQQAPWGAGGAPAAPPAAIPGANGSMEQLVPSAMAGRLIGKGGAGIKEMREMSGAQIKINSDPEPGTDSRKVTVTGTPEQTQIALSLINQRLAMGP